MSQSLPKQIPQVARLLSKSANLVDAVEDAFKELESNHYAPSLRESLDEFSRALIEYRDLVLNNMVAASISSAGD